MASTEGASEVVVVGSINYDLFMYTPRMPVAGETLFGHSFMTGFGGKGANQAAMCAKLGTSTAMIGKVGNDTFGREYLANFKALGVDTTRVGVEEDVETAVATVTVDDEGENRIILIKGANFEVTPEYLQGVRQTIRDCKVVVCQNEIPLESTLCALRLGREEGKITIFNPAPANAVLPDEAFTLCDIICPNETESAIISGNETVETSEGAQAAALMLLAKGAKSVVMTLGARGALVATSAEDMEIIASPKLKKEQVVDTTGAGDSFIGSMASFLAKGLTLKDAVRRACVVASITVQAKGAQASYPAVKDLPADMMA